MWLCKSPMAEPPMLKDLSQKVSNLLSGMVSRRQRIQIPGRGGMSMQVGYVLQSEAMEGFVPEEEELVGDLRLYSDPVKMDEGRVDVLPALETGLEKILLYLQYTICKHISDQRCSHRNEWTCKCASQTNTMNRKSCSRGMEPRYRRPTNTRTSLNVTH